MTDADRAALVSMLKRHEGVRLMPYKDSRGLLTIGCGRNIEARGITSDESDFLLNNDIDLCVRGLGKNYPWFADLDAARSMALIDLAFNLGLAGLAAFTKFLAAMARTDYENAADELRASAWYSQVGVRGPEIVSMIRGGVRKAA